MNYRKAGDFAVPGLLHLFFYFVPPAGFHNAIHAASQRLYRGAIVKYKPVFQYDLPCAAFRRVYQIILLILNQYEFIGHSGFLIGML